MRKRRISNEVAASDDEILRAVEFNRNGSPDSIARNVRDPLGCQKFTSSGRRVANRVYHPRRLRRPKFSLRETRLQAEFATGVAGKIQPNQTDILRVHDNL